MRYLLVSLSLLSVACVADETPIKNVSAEEPIADSGAPSNGDKAAAKFTTDAKWETAGYNNDEIVYTILVTSHDSRIIRCTTSLQGSYYENGQKQTVSDRQMSTVFPNQQVQVGNWMGMDQQSGATYAVHCHPI